MHFILNILLLFPVLLWSADCPDLKCTTESAGDFPYSQCCSQYGRCGSTQDHCVKATCDSPVTARCPASSHGSRTYIINPESLTYTTKTFSVSDTMTFKIDIYTSFTYVLIYESVSPCDDAVNWYRNDVFFRRTKPYISNPNRFSFLGEDIAHAIPTPSSCESSPSNCWVPLERDNFRLEVFNSAGLKCKTINIAIESTFSGNCGERSESLRPSVMNPTQIDKLYANVGASFTIYRPGQLPSGCSIKELYYMLVPTDGSSTLEIKKSDLTNNPETISIPYGGIFDYYAKVVYDDLTQIVSLVNNRLCVHSEPLPLVFTYPLENAVVSDTLTFTWEKPKIKNDCGDKYMLYYKFYRSDTTSEPLKTSNNFITVTGQSGTILEYHVEIEITWTSGTTTFTTKASTPKRKVWFCKELPKGPSFSAIQPSNDSTELTWNAANFSDCKNGQYAVFVGSGTTFDLYKKDINSLVISTGDLPAGTFNWYVLAYYGNVESGFSISSNICSYTKSSILQQPVLVFPLAATQLNSLDFSVLRFRWEPLSSWGTETNDNNKKYELYVNSKLITTVSHLTIEYSYSMSSFTFTQDVTWHLIAVTSSARSLYTPLSFNYCLRKGPSITNTGELGVISIDGMLVLRAPKTAYDVGVCCPVCSVRAIVNVYVGTFTIDLLDNVTDYPFTYSVPGTENWSVVLTNGIDSTKHSGVFVISQCNIELKSPENRAKVNDSTVRLIWTTNAPSCSLFTGQSITALNKIPNISSNYLLTLNSGSNFWQVECDSCRSAVFSVFKDYCSGDMVFPELVYPKDGEEIDTMPPYLLRFTGNMFAGCLFTSSYVMFVQLDSKRYQIVESSEYFYFVSVDNVQTDLHTWFFCFADSISSTTPFCSPQKVFSNCSTMRTKPLLISPRDNTEISSYPLLFEWNKSESKCMDVYFTMQKINIVTVEGLQTYPLNSETNTYSYAHKSSAYGTLRWRVSTVLPYGHEVESDEWTLINCVTTLSPPTPRAATDSVSTVNLSWIPYTDGLCKFVSDKIQYELVFSQNNEPFYTITLSSTSYNGNANINASAFLSWKVAMVSQVTSEDSDGKKVVTEFRSDYSTPQVTFLCIISAPPPTEYISPLNGYVTKHIAEAEITFIWKQSFFGTKCTSGTTSDQVGYYVFVLDGKSTTFEVPFISINPSGSYIHRVSSLSSGDHVWRVDKTYGDKTTKGASQTFTLCSGTKPNPPTLVYPPDTHASVPEYPFVLEWKSDQCGIGCPEGSCIGEVFLWSSTDSQMRSVGVGNGKLEISVSDDGNYFWTVRLNNNYDVGETATPWKIKICNPSPPEAPVVSIKENKETETLTITFEHKGEWGSSCYTKNEKKFTLSYTNTYTSETVNLNKELLSTSTERSFTINKSVFTTVGKLLITVTAINTDNVSNSGYATYIVCAPLNAPKPISPNSSNVANTVGCSFEWEKKTLNEVGFPCNNEDPNPIIRVLVTQQDNIGNTIIAASANPNTDRAVSSLRLPVATPYCWTTQVFVSQSFKEESSESCFVTKSIDCTNKSCPEIKSECEETLTNAICICASGWSGDLCEVSATKKALTLIFVIGIPIVLIFIIGIIIFLIKRRKGWVNFTFTKKNFQDYYFERCHVNGSGRESPNTASFLSTDHNYGFIMSLKLLNADPNNDNLCRSLLYAWTRRGFGIEFVVAAVTSEIHSSRINNAFFQSNTPGVKVLYYFSRMYGLSYLWDTLHVTLEHIINKEAKKRNIVISVEGQTPEEPSSIALETMSLNSDSQLWCDDESVSIDFLSTQLDAQLIFDAITRSKNRVPSEFCKLLSEVKLDYVFAFPDNPVYVPLSAIFIQRFLIASFTTPKSFRAFDQTPKELHYYFNQLAKFIISACSLSPSGKDQLQNYIDSFVEDNTENLQDFFLDLCSKGEHATITMMEVPDDIYATAINVINDSMNLVSSSSSSSMIF